MSMMIVSNSFGRGFSSMLAPAASQHDGVLWSGSADYDHDSGGFIQFSTSRVVATQLGGVRIYIERSLGGFKGLVGATVSVLSTTGPAGMTAGVHMPVLSKLVTFGDGEAASKYIDIDITSVPGVGFYYFIVTLTDVFGGARLRNPEMHVYFNDGDVNPNAVIVSDGANFADVFDAQPAGALVLVREGTEYTHNVCPTLGTIGGYHLQTSGTQTARKFLMNYPGETPVVNQNYDGTFEDKGGDTTGGILYGGDYQTISGFKIQNTLSCGFIFSQQLTYAGLVIEDCDVSNVGDSPNGLADYPNTSSADNLAAIRPDYTFRAVFRDNTFSDIHDPRGATASGLATGIHGYYATEPWIHGNNFHTLEKAIYMKHPNQNGEPVYRVQGNSFSNFYGGAFVMEVAGVASQGAKDAVFSDNVVDLAGAAYDSTSHVKLFMSEMASQSQGVWVTGNTFIGGSHAVTSRGMDDFVFYNNDLQGCKYAIAWDGRNGDGAGQHGDKIQYCDHNNYNGVGTPLVTTSRYVNYNNYSNLTAWQAAFASSDPQVLRNVDANSTAAVTAGLGRFGLPVGAQ